MSTFSWPESNPTTVTGGVQNKPGEIIVEGGAGFSGISIEYEAPPSNLSTTIALTAVNGAEVKRIVTTEIDRAPVHIVWGAVDGVFVYGLPGELIDDREHHVHFKVEFSDGTWVDPKIIINP